MFMNASGETKQPWRALQSCKVKDTAIRKEHCCLQKLRGPKNMVVIASWFGPVSHDDEPTNLYYFLVY